MTSSAPGEPTPQEPPAGETGPTLREPAHRVSDRAVPYWRLTAFLGSLGTWLALSIGYAFWTDPPWWATTLLVLVVAGTLVHLVVMPRIRYRVHRWEVTPTAVHTRAGWLSREERIAPLSRVQTVDTAQGALMRAFGLMSITVTTASAAGPITIEALDVPVARQVVAELTAITGSSAGDAT